MPMTLVYCFTCHPLFAWVSAWLLLSEYLCLASVSSEDKSRTETQQLGLGVWFLQLGESRASRRSFLPSFENPGARQKKIRTKMSYMWGGRGIDPTLRQKKWSETQIYANNFVQKNVSASLHSNPLS